MITRLKTATESEMLTALKSALLVDADGELITTTHDYFVSIVGELCDCTGVILTDDEGNDYPEKLPLVGYHANLVTKDASIIAALADVTIAVNSPLIKIAGEV